MDYTNALSQIGLSVSESKVYLFLLSNGPCYAAQLQLALSMGKVQVYRSLDELKSRKFVATIGETRNQQFTAESIDVLLSEYESKMSALDAARDNLQNLARDIAQKSSSLYKENRIKIYEGLEGYQLWMDERLKGKPELIREFGTNPFVQQFYGSDQAFEEYMNSYIERRVKAGVQMRSIGSREELYSFDTSSASILKEQRFIDSTEPMDTVFSTFGDRFGFYSRQGSNYVGVIIQDETMARLLSLMFDSLWKTADEADINE